MKKNFLNSLLALFVMLFASCSQEEIVSTSSSVQGGSEVTVSVNIPEEDVLSRAMPVVDGVTRRCIMQLVDASGVAIADSRFVEEVTGETVSFTFTAPEGEYQCVFWADYVDKTIDTDYIYDTSALPAVGYTNLSHTVHFSDAADAFCGVLSPAAGTTSVTLKRPLTKIVIGTNDPSQYEGYTLVRVANVGIPSGYNILSRTINTETSKTTRLDNTSMENAETGEWAHFYVFASADQTAYTFPEEYPLNITISNGNADENKSASITSLPLDDNMVANINFSTGGGEEPEPGNDMTINVSFDEDYEEPADPNALSVGDYINAAGEKVASVSDAVAVVFSLADGVTDDSEYGEGKTAKAYAISLTSGTASRTYSTNYYSLNLDVTAEGSYAGYAFTSAIEGKMVNGTDYRNLSNFFNANQAPALSGQNLSGWYIPSLAQLQDAIALENATLRENLAAAFENDYYCASSSVVDATTEHRLQGCLISSDTEKWGNVTTLQENTSFHIFPVVTIFE